MEISREEGLEVRRLVYDDLVARRRHALQLNADHGKWLVTSLFLVHGATLIFLGQSERLSQAVLPTVYWWVIIGLLSALACGFATWINWTLHASVYDEVQPTMIIDDGKWPKFSGSDHKWINPTMWISVGLGMISALCIFGAAVAAFSIIAVKGAEGAKLSMIGLPYDTYSTVDGVLQNPQRTLLQKCPVSIA